MKLKKTYGSKYFDKAKNKGKKLETNILIDDLPTDYNGYLINYTFKSGILISECLNDNSFKDERKKYIQHLESCLDEVFHLLGFRMDLNGS